MVGLDCDNGGEFINHALIAWCAERTIFMTRARAHTSNDNATWALSLEVCALARVMKIVRSAHQAIRAWLMNSPPLSELCRRRHNSDYADLRIMPTCGREPLLLNGSG